MSKLSLLALTAALAAAQALPVQAQVATRGAVAVSRAPVRAAPIAPVARPDVVRVDPTRIDPTRRRDHDGDALQQRLRNACFNSPNPPPTVCRRYFGDGGSAPSRGE